MLKFAYPLVALALAGCSSPCADPTVTGILDKLVFENLAGFGYGATFIFYERKDVTISFSGTDKVEQTGDLTTCKTTVTIQNNVPNGSVTQKPIRYTVSTLPDKRTYVQMYYR